MSTHFIFFDLHFASNALGMWTMTSARGVVRAFCSRTDALTFAIREARQVQHGLKAAIRVEGADHRWRSFDQEMKALVADPFPEP